VFVTVFALGAWAAGRAVRRRQLRAQMLSAEAVRVADERDSRAEAAVAEERRRIARELHDVVAHSMGVIVVQAQAAAGMLDDDAAPAREVLESIERTGREALGEMRRMLGLIRERADKPVGPLPSLRGVEPLIADVRAAGLPVSVEIRGAERPLPAGVDASAYRILQEGLTNVRKHAGAAHARSRNRQIAGTASSCRSAMTDAAPGRRPSPVTVCSGSASEWPSSTEPSKRGHDQKAAGESRRGFWSSTSQHEHHRPRRRRPGAHARGTAADPRAVT
jgi:Histidine kinase